MTKRKEKRVTRSFEMVHATIMMIELATRTVKEFEVDTIKGDDLLAVAEAENEGFKAVTVLAQTEREEIRMMTDTVFFKNSVVYER